MVRVSFIEPVAEETGAEVWIAPESASVLEPSDIVVVRICTPDLLISVGCDHRPYFSSSICFAQASCARSLGSLRLRLGVIRSAGEGTVTVSWAYDLCEARFSQSAGNSLSADSGIRFTCQP